MSNNKTTKKAAAKKTTKAAPKKAVTKKNTKPAAKKTTTKKVVKTTPKKTTKAVTKKTTAKKAPVVKPVKTETTKKNKFMEKAKPVFNKIKKWVVTNKLFIGIFAIGLVIGISIMYFANYGNIATLKNGEEIVVSIDGLNITAESLYEDLRENAGMSQVINTIDKHILETKFKDSKDDANNYAVDYIDSLKQSYSENWEDFLAYYGFNNEDELKEQLISEYYTSLNTTEYLEAKLTDKEIEKYYNDEIVGDIKVSHILIKPEDLDEDATDEEKEAADQAARDKAADLIKQLDKSDDPLTLFAELAKENSDDASNKDEGGDLGYFNKNQMEKTFEEAAYKLEKVAEYTALPIETGFGYHVIIKTAETKEKDTLEEAREGIVDVLVSAKAQEDPAAYIKAMDALRKEFNLKFEEPSFEDEYKELITKQINEALENQQ